MTERKVWFITRPERDPKFHQDALIALKKATKDFTVKWSGNREAHMEYERVLSMMGLKRENISNDGSGGRTWAAMLKTFAYCYTNEEGYLVPTKVGLSLINNENVVANVSKQILTLQIPNAYFLEAGFRPKFEKDFRIRPARFLIKLTNQEALDYYVTKEEITFFVLTAKNDNQINDITKKIVDFRKASPSQKESIRQSIADEYEHRGRSDKGARDFSNAHSDVAHTFMLICDYTGLAEYIRGEALRVEPSKSKNVHDQIATLDERYQFNTRFMISLERMAESNGLDVESYKASRYGSKKPAANKGKTERKIQQIFSSYPSVMSLSHEEIIDILKQFLPQHEAEKRAFEMKEQPFNILNEEFVEAYLNEEDGVSSEDKNRVFEDKTGEIFKAIGFDVVMRPKSVSGDRTEIEILLKYGEFECGLIDAKNYRKSKFSLPANLASHMSSEYIPNYEGYEGRKIQFFGYVTAGEFSGEKNLQKITQHAQRLISREIKGIMMNAKVLLGFLDYCIENELSTEERISFFLKAVDNKAYSTFGQFLKEVK